MSGLNDWNSFCWHWVCYRADAKQAASVSAIQSQTLFPQTLYTYPENWRAFKAQIAAQYSGARLKIASAPPAFTFGQTNRSPAFLGNFPLGKVSVLRFPPPTYVCALMQNEFINVLPVRLGSSLPGWWWLLSVWEQCHCSLL